MWGRWGLSSILAVVGWLCVSLLSAPQARAQQGSVAEELFQQGRALLAEGDVSSACSKFEESQRLDPATGTLLNLAVCHEEEGKLATAWSEYQEVLDRSLHDGRRDRVDYARIRLEALEPRLPRLMIKPGEGPPQDLVVYLDDAPLSRAALGIAFPIDAGEHSLRFEAPGFVAEARIVTIAQTASVLTLEVPLLSPVAQDSPAGPPPLATIPPGAVESDVKQNADVEDGGSATGRSPAFWIAGGTAALGAAMGTGLGIAAMVKNGSAACDATSCASVADRQAKQQASDLAVAADVAFVVGGVALAVTVTLWLLEGKRPDQSSGLTAARAGLGYGLRF